MNGNDSLKDIGTDVLVLSGVQNGKTYYFSEVIRALEDKGVHVAVISAKDYGAKCNDKNDDTKAIQAAINGVKIVDDKVYFSDENYLIDHYITYDWNEPSIKRIKKKGPQKPFYRQGERW